jgi:hypothetical protein
VCTLTQHLWRVCHTLPVHPVPLKMTMTMMTSTTGQTDKHKRPPALQWTLHFCAHWYRWPYTKQWSSVTHTTAPLYIASFCYALQKLPHCFWKKQTTNMKLSMMDPPTKPHKADSVTSISKLSLES